jgi:tRNA A37 threonylcarbamoyladenosine dehydratase
MARINLRPEIIYVKDLSETDKDNFEKIMNKLRLTNNGEAVKRIFSEYLKSESDRLEKSNEIIRLNKELEDARKERQQFINNAGKLIESISTVEDNLKLAKKELTKLSK